MLVCDSQLFELRKKKKNKTLSCSNWTAATVIFWFWHCLDVLALQLTTKKPLTFLCGSAVMSDSDWNIKINFRNVTKCQRAVFSLFHNGVCPLLIPHRWKLCLLQPYLEPVYFYIYTVFSLQAVYVIALYLTAWLLSGSWLAGALAGVWYILNR